MYVDDLFSRLESRFKFDAELLNQPVHAVLPRPDPLAPEIEGVFADSFRPRPAADTVAGFLAVAECDAAVGQVLNVGSNFEISIGDTARLIAEVMGADVEFVTEEERMRPTGSEVERLWADAGKARELAGWEPQYAGRDGFRRGIEETVAWFRDPANLERYKAHRYNI